MADGITIQISGLTEIQEQLRQLPGKIAKKVVYQALRAGATVVHKQVQANAPVRTRTLKKGFKIARSRIHRSATEFGVYMTLKKGGGRADPKDAFYGRWVENGYLRGKKTQTVRTARSDRPGQSRNRLVGTIQVPGQFFIKRAFDAKKNQAVDTIVQAAEAKIEILTRNIGH
jgi:HK97 gp10 family phage protein